MIEPRRDRGRAGSSPAVPTTLARALGSGEWGIWVASDLMAGLKAIDEARPAYELARKFYDGDVDEVFTSARLRLLFADQAGQYRMNLAKTPVNAVVNRLEIAAVSVQGSAEQTQLLADRVWTANQMDLEAPDIHLGTCEFGDYYLIVWDGDEDGTVDMFGNSPLNCRMMYDPDNPRRKRYLIKVRKVGKRRRATLYYADRVERYTTVRDDVTGEAETDWEEYVDHDGDAWPIPNPYGAVPAFHFRTGRPYGLPLHLGAYGPQNAINKLVATQMGTVDYAGAPQRYALQDRPAASDDSVAADFGDEGTEVDGQAEGEQYQAGPATVWLMKGVKGVGQFAVAEPKTFLDPLELYVRLMAQITEMPLHLFDPGGDQPSGESRRTADTTLVKKVRYLTLSLVATWADALEFALKVLDVAARVDVRYANPDSVDSVEGWQVTAAKVAAGVPLRQALLEAGYTAAQLDEWGIPAFAGQAPPTVEQDQTAEPDPASGDQDVAA